MIIKINENYGIKKGRNHYILLQLSEDKTYREVHYCEDCDSLITRLVKHAFNNETPANSEKIYDDVILGVEKIKAVLIPEYSDEHFKKEATFAYNVISQEGTPILMSDSLREAVLIAFNNGGKVIPLANVKPEVSLYDSADDESTMYDEWLATALEYLQGDEQE